MICTKCSVEKDANMFRIVLSRRNGVHPWCRDCERKGNRDRYVRKPPRQKKIVDKSILKFNQLKRMLFYRYKISYETYLGMYEEQNKSCKICRTENVLGGRKGLQVDHCHVNGRIRGLICPRCNTGMQFIDKIKQLSIISDYLSGNNDIIK